MQRLLINNLRYNIVTDTVSESGLVSSLVMFYTLTDLFGKLSQIYKLIEIIADKNSSIRCKILVFGTLPLKIFLCLKSQKVVESIVYRF